MIAGLQCIAALVIRLLLFKIDRLFDQFRYITDVLQDIPLNISSEWHVKIEVKIRAIYWYYRYSYLYL